MGPVQVTALVLSDFFSENLVSFPRVYPILVVGKCLSLPSSNGLDRPCPSESCLKTNNLFDFGNNLPALQEASLQGL